MNEYFYTTKDRIGQIQRLAVSLKILIEELNLIGKFSSQIEDYQQALKKCHELLQHGFSQEQLSELSRAVPDLFYRHKEWMPPLEKNFTGELCEPDWFVLIEEKLQAVLSAAWALRVVGTY